MKDFESARLYEAAFPAENFPLRVKVIDLRPFSTLRWHILYRKGEDKGGTLYGMTGKPEKAMNRPERKMEKAWGSLMESGCVPVHVEAYVRSENTARDALYLKFNPRTCQLAEKRILITKPEEA